MKTYALVDLNNVFWRCRYVAARNSDAWTKLGSTLSITLTSVNQIVRLFEVDHVVFALDGRSWRKDFYKPYKANRVNLTPTEEEVEESNLFYEAYNTFEQFLKEKTNTSVIRCPVAEADDVIARFIKLHPDDKHFIISTDSDFVQLINENVSQYNGITNQLITKDGYFNERKKPIIDKKTGKQKLLEDPEYQLFKKIIRGDATDNVFSAYPGVREKGSAKSVGIQEAFADRNKQGFHWNNLQLQRWTDHNDVEHRVRDDFERNKILIDLDAQPQEIKDAVDKSIVENLRIMNVSIVGFHFLKFTGKWELTKISEQADTYCRWLNASYSGNLNSVIGI